MKPKTTAWPLAKTAGLLSLIIPLAVGIYYYLPVIAGLPPYWPVTRTSLVGIAPKDMSLNWNMYWAIPWLVFLTYFVSSLVLSGQQGMRPTKTDAKTVDLSRNDDVSSRESIVFSRTEQKDHHEYICLSLGLIFYQRLPQERTIVFGLRDIDTGEEIFFTGDTNYRKEEIEEILTAPWQETYKIGQKVFPFELMRSILHSAMNTHTEAIHGSVRPFADPCYAVLFVSVDEMKV